MHLCLAGIALTVSTKLFFRQKKALSVPFKGKEEFLCYKYTSRVTKLEVTTFTGGKKERNGVEELVMKALRGWKGDMLKHLRNRQKKKTYSRR